MGIRASRTQVARDVSVRPAPSLAHDLERDQVGRDREFRDALHRIRVARAAWTAHVAEERLHGWEVALDVDEDSAIGAVRDASDDAVPMGRLRDSRAIVHALDAPLRETMPVDYRTHGHGE